MSEQEVRILTSEEAAAFRRCVVWQETSDIFNQIDTADRVLFHIWERIEAKSSLDPDEVCELVDVLWTAASLIDWQLTRYRKEFKEEGAAPVA